MPRHERSRLRPWLPVLLITAGLAALPLTLVLDRGPNSKLSHIRETGTLRVLTIEGPTTYYRTADGPSGFEYDLLNRFAEELGVTLQFEIADSLASVFPRLMRGDAHFAAAALNITEPRRQLVRFAEPYQSIETQVVYRRGQDKPHRIEDLIGRDVAVPAGSAYSQLLNVKKAEYPALEWSESSIKTAEDLLVDVWEQELGVTFSPSNLLAIVRQHHPELRAGFSLDARHQLAWAFRPDTDMSLIDAVNGFLERMRASGELARLIDRYYGAATKFDYVNVATFTRRIKSVLPRYEPLFKKAGVESNLDWRLLAAQAYQESYWKPGAVSPTGVKGLMQLTKATARFIDVEDRTDPRQSVMGGARYLRSLHDRIDESVTEPDRTWFALAAYNVGLGHLLDARALARRHGRNPDRWTDVRPMLELLSDPKWHETTEYGYARGYQAVAYVTRIRSFYDILVQRRPQPPRLKAFRISVPAL